MSLFSCPNCDKGRLFSGIAEIAKNCENCGLDFSGHDVGDGPVYFLVVVLSTIVTAMALWLEFSYSPPFWLHIVLWPPIIIASSITGLRVSKAILLKKQYEHRQKEFEKK